MLHWVPIPEWDQQRIALAAFKQLHLIRKRCLLIYPIHTINNFDTPPHKVLT